MVSRGPCLPRVSTARRGLKVRLRGGQPSQHYTNNVSGITETPAAVQLGYADSPANDDADGHDAASEPAMNNGKESALRRAMKACPWLTSLVCKSRDGET